MEIERRKVGGGARSVCASPFESFKIVRVFFHSCWSLVLFTSELYFTRSISLSAARRAH